MATTTTPRKAAAAKAPAKSTNVAKKRVPVIGTSGPKTVTRSRRRPSLAPTKPKPASGWLP